MEVALVCECGTAFTHRKFVNTRGRAFCSAECAQWASEGIDPDAYRLAMGMKDDPAIRRRE